MNRINLSFSTVFLVLFCIHCANNHQENSNPQKDSSNKNILLYKPCKGYDNLIELGTNFKPTDLDLNLSLKKNIQLNLFLDTIDKNCLLNQNNYKLFIAIILVKQYYFHLSNYHQGFDLLSMRIGNASKIVDCFREMTNKRAKLEMLNSGLIENYLQENPKIRNVEINNYLKRINAVGDSIKMGAYW